MPEETNNDQPQFECEDCGETQEVSERHHSTSLSGAMGVCQSCFDESYFICTACARPTRDTYGFYVEGDYWCEQCHDQVFTACEHCSETIRIDEARIRGDWDSTTLCDDCADAYDNEQEELERFDRSCIRNYGYKPNAIFHTTTEYGDLLRSHSLPWLNEDTELQPVVMGFELEMESRESRFVSDSVGGHGYLKDDGSIRGEGFELVTHPHSLDAYKRHFPWAWMEEARKNGARAWNNTSCGLHIHVNKLAFSGRAHWARFWILLHRNSGDWIQFAGRSSSYAKWDEGAWTTGCRRAAHEFPFILDARPQYEDIDYYRMTTAEINAAEQRNNERWHEFRKRNRFLDQVSEQSERYVALNCHNSHTFELRFFRPSMRANTVLASLESVAAAIEYTRGLTVIKGKGDLATKKELLTWQSFRDWVRANKDTYPYFDARIDVRFGTSPDDADSAS